MIFSGVIACLAGCGKSKNSFPQITQRVQNWVDHGFYPGCAVWIAQENRVLYEKCFGSFTPETEVFIASAGKWLGAATLLAVVDEGSLSLDDRVDHWLPEFRGDPKGSATLRQLLSHTSGFSPYQPKGRPPDDYQTTAESVLHLLPLPLNSKPGKKFEYGGLAMQVAGRMAEVATGKTWEGIFQEKLASPLGMNRTRFTPVDPGHTPMIAGGAVSTLRDYSRFLTMVADGGVFLGKQVLSESAIRAMQEDQVGDAEVSRDEFVERRRGKTHRGVYGLGMWREELDEKGNVVLMSSPSWAGCYPWIDKKHDIRGLILGHVDTKVTEKAKFSGFWSSPVLMNLVRAQLEGEFSSNPPADETGVATVSGGDLFWETAGVGDPLIFLHGHSLDRRMWDLQTEHLSRRYRVIRYDLRGYGLSDLPVEGQKFRHADDLASLMDILRIQKAHVVGLSLGAYVVADFLALHPDRILTATMASGGVYRGPGTRVLEGVEYGNRLREIEQTRSEGIELFKERWREVLLRSTMDLSLRDQVTTMISDWSAWQPLHVEPALLLGPESILRMTKTPPSLPVLWIAGDKDYNPTRLQPFLKIFPDTKVVVLPGAGHLCNMDQPNAFSEALEDFLGKACPERRDRAPDRLTVERQEGSYIRAPLDKKETK